MIVIQITHLPVLFFKDVETPRVELRIEEVMT